MSKVGGKVPLWSIAHERRIALDPSELGDRVVHYSIPSVDEFGTGRTEKSKSIKSAKLLLRGGEILISKLNPRKSRVIHVGQHSIPAVSSTEFVGLQPLPNADPRFLRYALQSNIVRQELDSKVQSVTRSHQRVTPEDVTHLSVWMPEKPIQQRVADFLDAETAHIDRLIRLRREMSARLTERENALRDNLIEHVAESGDWIPLRRLITTIEQGASPQCHSAPRQEESEWGVLKLSSVKRGTFFSRENKKLPEGENVATLKEVRPGDLLVTRANTPTLVGDATVTSEPCSNLLLPDLIYRVNLTPDTQPDFVAQVLLGNRTRSLIESIARGSSQSMVKLRGEDIKALPIPRISPSRQEHFIREMTGSSALIEELRSKLTRQVDLLMERQQALITAAVTGQFDVSTASGRGVTE